MQPLHGHLYHAKSDAQLRYIIKDAGEAAICMRGVSVEAECKYLDQVNDACTVINWRREQANQFTRGGGSHQSRWAV